MVRKAATWGIVGLVIVAAFALVPKTEGTGNRQTYLPAVSGPLLPTPTPASRWAPWPMAGHDAAQTSRSPYVASRTLTERWLYLAKWQPTLFYPGYPGVPPAIAADGTIYLAVNPLNVGWTGGYPIYAINPDGTPKWSYSLDTRASALAVGPSGTIYVGTNCDGKYIMTSWLLAVNPDGTTKWRYTALPCVIYYPAIGEPAVDAAGRIYLPATDGLHAFNPDGTQAWFFPTSGAGLGGTPVIDGNGEVYYGVDRHVYALHPDGTRDWSVATVDFSPYLALGTNSSVYAYDRFFLYALNPDGSIQWQSPQNPDASGSGLWPWVPTAQSTSAFKGESLPSIPTVRSSGRPFNMAT